MLSSPSRLRRHVSSDFCKSGPASREGDVGFHIRTPSGELATHPAMLFIAFAEFRQVLSAVNGCDGAMLGSSTMGGRLAEVQPGGRRHAAEVSESAA